METKCILCGIPIEEEKDSKKKEEEKNTKSPANDTNE